MVKKIFSIVNSIVKNLFTQDKESILVRWYDMQNTIPNNSIVEIPKIIWIYWDSDKIPEIVKICIDSVEKHCTNYKINILTLSTLDNYIKLPHISSDVEPANIADLIRLMLLEEYGGIWMDASIFLTENLDWIVDRMEKQDAFLFYSDECTVDAKHPISENWLIVAPKKSLFIKDWLEEYKKCILSSNPKGYYSSLKNNKEVLQNLNNPEYLLCYISAIITLQKGKYNILYASSGTTGHYYNYKYLWNAYAISTLLLLRDRNSIAVPKLVKITGSVRPAISRFIKYKFYSKKSLLGNYLINSK